jgi:hypothetical protein
MDGTLRDQQLSTCFNKFQQLSTVFNKFQQSSTVFNSYQQLSTISNSVGTKCQKNINSEQEQFSSKILEGNQKSSELKYVVFSPSNDRCAHVGLTTYKFIPGGRAKSQNFFACTRALPDLPET